MKFNNYEGKKVFLILKSGRRYSGQVKEVDNDFLKITDKFGAAVAVRISEIELLEEEKDGN